MAGPPEVIDLGSSSDYDSNGADGFITPPMDMSNNNEPSDLGNFSDSDRRDSMNRGHRSTFDTCLRDILEVFPDISHEHVRDLYNNRDHNPDHGQTVEQCLIEQILDGGRYPKERERLRELKELKRKREDRNSDDEEAARWKFIDLRDDPLEYAKVA